MYEKTLGLHKIYTAPNIRTILMLCPNDTVSIGHHISIYENQSTVSAELRIVVDGSIELYVVNVIDFNAQDQIQAIRAYLGRGDGG